MPRGSSGLFRFGNFELAPRTRELRRGGKPVPLQFQPFKLLHYLLERAGEVVTRQELKEHLWGEQTFVDFEAGLNFSIRQIRRALGESARCPALLQTYNRCGYRFLGEVAWVADALEIPLERGLVMKLDHALFFDDEGAVTRLAEQIARMLVAACRQEILADDRRAAINVLLRPAGDELSLVLTATG
jgi:DNA-binding winged helix-turn-helix (wHTH) protein